MWTGSLSGLSAVEDFVPVGDESAIVTAGTDLCSLTHVLRVDYKFVTGQLVLERPEVLHTGGYLRLGRQTEDGTIQFSDGRFVPHQPFEEFYTDDAPNGRIYRDGEVFIDHFDEYVEVGNPWRSGRWLYFECRKALPQAPLNWELWKMNLDTMEKRFVIEGANPCVYKDRLHISVWNAKDWRFDFGIVAVQD